MELSYAKLNDDQVVEALKGLDGWEVAGGVLTKTFETSSYPLGLALVSAIGWLAEGLNHHPDLVVGYRKVKVELTTHDAGGLTAYDFELARRIDELTRSR